MRAIQDRVIVEPIFAEQVSSSGIYLGEGEMTDTARVLAVGPGTKTEFCVIPVSVQPGDIVYITSGAGVQTKVGKRKVLVLREQDIFGIKTE
jgi:co-chaperonin GroES (HSP10)